MSSLSGRIRNVATEFSQTISIHGIHYVISSKTKWMAVLWMMIVGVTLSYSTLKIKVLNNLKTTQVLSLEQEHKRS